MTGDFILKKCVIWPKFLILRWSHARYTIICSAVLAGGIFYKTFIFFMLHTMVIIGLQCTKMNYNFLIITQVRII